MFAYIMETISYPYMRRAPFRKIVKNILQLFPYVNLFLMHLFENSNHHFYSTYLRKIVRTGYKVHIKLKISLKQFIGQEYRSSTLMESR